METNVFREKYRTQIVWGVTVLVLLVLAISCYFLFLRMDDMAKLVRTVTGVLTPLSFGLVIAYLLDSMVAAFTRLLGKIPRPVQNISAHQGGNFPQPAQDATYRYCRKLRMRWKVW